MGDRVRKATGSFVPHGNKSCYIHWMANGAFYPTGENSYSFYKGDSVWEANSDNTIIYNTSRVIPTGAANVPRSWGSLACAYFGRPRA